MASFVEFILSGHVVGSFDRCRKILDTLELFGVATENFILEATTADTTEASAADTSKTAAQEMVVIDDLLVSSADEIDEGAIDQTIEMVVSSKRKVVADKKCLLCQKKFKYSSHAKNHMAISHSGAIICDQYVNKIGPEQFKCTICKKIYQSKTGAKQHVGKDHDHIRAEIIKQYTASSITGEKNLVSYSGSDTEEVGSVYLHEYSKRKNANFSRM